MHNFNLLMVKPVMLAVALAMVMAVPPANAALSLSTVWEIRTTGSDTSNSGGFNPTNVNFTTDLACTSATGNTPSCTSASYTFVSGDTNAYLYISYLSSAGWKPGWYKITSVSAGAATVNAAIGAAVLYWPYLSSPQTAQFLLNPTAGVNTSASPTGGAWGIDYSQQASAAVAFTDMIIGVTTTQFTSVLNPVGVNMIGNLIRVTSGTGFTTGFFEIVSTATITATCDRSLGTTASTGGNAGLGGALASIGQYGGAKAQRNSVFIQSGTYLITTATANVAGGVITDTTSGVASNTGYYVGYNTNRVLGNTDTKPLFQASGAISTFSIFGLATGTFLSIENVSIDCAAKTATKALTIGSNTIAYNVKVANCTTNNVTTSQRTSYLVNLESTGATAAATTGSVLLSNGAVGYAVVAHGNDTYGIFISSSNCHRCISYANTGATSHGFFGNSTTYVCTQCVSYGNGGAGFSLGSIGNGSPLLVNCIAEANTDKGYLSNNVNSDTVGFNNAGYNNGGTTALSGQYTAADLPQWYGYIANTSGSFFVNAAGGNFAPNSITNQGALLTSSGYPSLFQDGTTANYPTVGAAQAVCAITSGIVGCGIRQ